jgi:hypothetical protein
MMRIRKYHVVWVVGAGLISAGARMFLGAQSTAQGFLGAGMGAVGFLLFVGAMMARGADPNA